MIEIEQKYVVDDLQGFVRRLVDAGATEGRTEHHEDHYFNHPAKDFAETGEAFRIRVVDGAASVTYKGPKLPGDIKAREEREWSLGPEDADGRRWRDLLTTLDFRPVATVRKTRRTFRLNGLTVTADAVADLGSYAEIETVVSGPDDVPSARRRIAESAASLGLEHPEARSYLRLLLAGRGEG